MHFQEVRWHCLLHRRLQSPMPAGSFDTELIQPATCMMFDRQGSSMFESSAGISEAKPPTKIGDHDGCVFSNKALWRSPWTPVPVVGKDNK